MVTVNAVSVTVYTKRNQLNALRFLRPLRWGFLKSLAIVMDLTLLIDLWKDRPFLPHNPPPPPPTPHSYYWTT